MKVAILTMFNGLSPTYSLVNVVADQVRMLLHARIPVKVLVSESCPDRERTGAFADPRLEWVKITNTYQGHIIHWHDYSQAAGSVHETFRQEAESIAEDYVRHLQDVDVCFLHDILYQGWHLLHNIAIRTAQPRLPHVKFLAFTHSLPVTPPPQMESPFSARFSPMPRTTFIYPTKSGIAALARQYHVPEDHCAVVNNSLPLVESLGPDVEAVARHLDLADADILAFYPARLTPGKQPEKVAALAGAMAAQLSLRVRVIYCDFPCADISSSLYKTRIRKTGRDFGLSQEDILFTSDIGYPNGFPREGVLNLFTLSNLFICPSYSESFGLTVLEAASRGNFLVLNEAVPALQELGAALGAYFLRWNARNFGFDTRETYLPSEEAYYRERSRRIVEAMKKDASLQSKMLVRTRYQPDRIFATQLLPLLS